MQGDKRNVAGRERGIALLLFLVSIFIFLPALPYIELTGHEAREGMRLRAMLETGQWFFPEVLRKPPLYYWLSGLVAHARGGIVEPVSLRLPSVLLAGLGVLVVFRLGRFAASPLGGVLGGVILLTSLLYVQHGFSGRTDMALCFFVTWSLLLFFAFVTRAWPRDHWRPAVPYLFASALALALLSKGPVGVILVLLPITVFLLWRRDLSGVHPLFRPGPLLTFAVLGCGWYVAALWGAGDEFWRTQIGEENVSRFIGGIDTMSVFYYVGPLVGKAAPWSLVLPFALWRAFKEKKEGPMFLAIWWLTVVLFFQVAAYKRARYLLPAQPASALLIGWWFTTHLSSVTETAQGWRWWRSMVAVLTVAASLMITAGMIVLWGVQEDGLVSCRWLLSLVVRETPEQIALYCHWLAAHFWLSLLWFGLFAVCLGVLVGFLARVRLAQALVVLSLTLLLIYTGLYSSWIMVTSWALSPRGYGDRIMEKVGPQEHVFFISPSEEKGLPVLFLLQEHARAVEVKWPWGGPPPSLPAGYYLVSEERRAEVTTHSGGRWIEVLRDTGSTEWPLILYRYETDSLNLPR